MQHCSCHGSREPASEPGAPITAADDENQLFVTPGRSVDRAWLASLIPGMPIYMPADAAAPRPPVVPEIVARMTAPPASTTPGLAELGRHRFEALDGLGLNSPDTLGTRLAGLSDSDMAQLRYFLVDVAKTTIDVLAAQHRTPPGPAIIWGRRRRPGGDGRRDAAVGRSLPSQ